jgi:hypothetical protein
MWSLMTKEQTKNIHAVELSCESAERGPVRTGVAAGQEENKLVRLLGQGLGNTNYSAPESHRCCEN